MGSGETVGDGSTGPVGSHEEKYQVSGTYGKTVAGATGSQESMGNALQPEALVT